jgi:hypothetical protein
MTPGSFSSVVDLHKCSSLGNGSPFHRRNYSNIRQPAAINPVIRQSMSGSAFPGDSRAG